MAYLCSYQVGVKTLVIWLEVEMRDIKSHFHVQTVWLSQEPAVFVYGLGDRQYITGA
jgi:hypothetical protein